MPTVDVTAILQGLKPVRQTPSYTMPVLSPRHSSSSLSGSYRSTFSSSLSRPYYSSSNAYSTPRIHTTYSERFTTKSYSTDDGKKIYSRHTSITEDGITSRFREREESREKSIRRDSLSRDSGFKDSSTRSNSLRDTASLVHERDPSLTRSETSRDSRNNISSTLSMIETVADLRNKYSPANYVPAVLRKQDNISRSKSINDIGRPPLEQGKTNKKVIENGLISNNSVALSNNTNKLDNIAIDSDDSNGNRSTVAEIRKKFDPNYSRKISESNSLASGAKFCNRPAKCFKIVTDLEMQERDAKEDGPMEVASEAARPHHTTNFASYIPAKDFYQEEVPMNQSEDLEMDNEESQASGYTFQQNRIVQANNDISTSPRLNRSSISQTATSTSSSNNVPTLRSSPTVDRERERSREEDGRGLSSNPVRNQGLNGLKNIGNTCFMNSVIQCLSNTRYLLEYVKEDAYQEDINTSISSMKGALIKAFSQVIQELWSQDSSDRVVNTLALKSQIQRFAPRFIGYAQQDAQEFLRYLLEGLHEDVNRVTSKPAPILTEIDEKLSDAQKASESWQRYLRMDNSRVVDIFVGQLKSTLRCTHCGHCSVTFDPFWDLSLPIPQRQGALRLGQCLEHFTREETMDGDEKPTCSKCKERRKCTKSFSIQKFPKILVIHLKRFSPTERFRGKLNLVIDFPLQGLDLSAYAAQKGHTTDCMYNLYAISNHSGTTYSGHYTAYCKHPYSAQWHEYNDSRVSTILPKNVVSSEAYVLFYELVGQHSHL